MFLVISNGRTCTYHVFKDSFSCTGISIYKKKSGFFICLDKGYLFSDGEKIKKLELNKYTVVSYDNYYETDIYVYENDTGINDYSFYKRNNCIVSFENNEYIVSKDKYLKNAYLSITDNKISSNVEVFVNGTIYKEGQELKNGNLISILGLKIFVYSDFYYINSFLNEVHLDKYDIKQKKVLYRNKKEYPSLNICSTVEECVIDNPKEYVVPKTDKRELNTILPNVVMVLSVSFIAGISFYNSYLNNQPLLNRLAFIVMPIAMSISTIFIPVISYLLNKRKNRKITDKSIETYIEYLGEYEDENRKLIQAYLNECDSYYFSLIDCENKLFSLKRNSDYYLNVSLGKTTKSFDIQYKHTDIKIIDKKLRKIKYSFANVNNYPLMLNLKLYSRISVVSSIEEKDYYFNKFLLELSYKHHYDDLCIAIYSRKESVYGDFYNLPHLFVGNERLTFTSKKQLELLDNGYKFDKPVVVMMYDYSDVVFENNNIHCIYFSDNLKDLLKNSDAVIEYSNQTSHLYAGGRMDFVYIKEDIDFNKYYSYLGKLKHFDSERKVVDFNNVFNINDIGRYYARHDGHLYAVFAYNAQEMFELDLHETGHGPHGLIGGSTGSGKSELIISLVLSLCIKYPPDYLNIVLIDYKGSGLSDSLSYNGVNIPHVVGSVTNLDDDLLQRLIIRLNNECKKRQSLFNQMSQHGSSIMNLDDYISSDYDSYDLEKLAHLLIVVDEFAELKKNHPQEIKELISISRIGRSLGVHLILATQKPAGVIDDEIWSNSRFKIALKMFDERDSIDIIKTPDAAYLNKPGSFVLSYDDNLSRYQSIYSKSDMNGNGPISVMVFDNMLHRVSDVKQLNISSKSQCEAYCEKIIDISFKNGYQTSKFEFEKPEQLKRKQLCLAKCLVVGEADDYLNSKKGLLAYRLNDSLLIYSSRKNEINAYLNTFNEFDRQCVVIGGRYFRNEVISDCILYHEKKDVIYLLNNLINHDLHLTLLIEDVYVLLSYCDEYTDLLLRLMKQIKDKKTSVICFSSSTSLNYRLINCFSNKILIENKDPSSHIDFYAMKSRYKSDSFFFDGEPVGFVPIRTEEFVYGNSRYAKIINEIPDTINAQIIDGYLLIGYDIDNRKRVLSGDNIAVISMNDDSLNPYRQYKDIMCEKYSYKINVQGKDVLWIGPGIFSQHLFISGLRNDLSNQEGLYIHNGSSIRIKVLNSE